MKSEVLHSIQNIKAVDLATLAQVDFPSRKDTKFVFDPRLVPEFLSALQNDLHILEVKGVRLFDYENEYYDSSDYTFFRDHQIGKGNRIKVRSRKYGDAGPFYLEVKHKNNRKETIKERLTLDRWDDRTAAQSDAFLQERIGMGFDYLSQKTAVNYSRMTFANRDLTEKYTLDLMLNTRNPQGPVPFDFLAIAEVKQVQLSRKSPFMEALKERKIYPHTFSKYCYCVMHTQPGLKHNRFKPILRTTNKIKTKYDTAA